MSDEKKKTLDQEIHESAHKSKQKIGSKHGHVVDALIQAVESATPQDEHGRTDAAVRTFLKNGETMRNSGATIEDFMNAIESFHENRHLLVRKIKGEK